MSYRELRIAWSVGWGLAAVVMCMLWVRSYWVEDVLEKRTAWQLMRLESETSRLSFRQISPTRNPGTIQILLDEMELGGFHSRRPVGGDDRSAYWHQTSVVSFGCFGRASNRVIFIPHWFPVVVFAAISATPWIRWSRRFSLRALLIATALVAVVLGLILLARA
jgi:hypothetical protein